MEIEKGVARGLNVPGLEARMYPAAAENPREPLGWEEFSTQGDSAPRGHWVTSGDLVVVETGRCHWCEVGRGWGCCSAPSRAHDSPATKNHPPQIDDARADRTR